MKVLIYGHNNLIGSQFLKILEKSCTNYIRGFSRLDNIKEIENELNCFKPTHVILFIGRTNDIYDEKEYTTIDYIEQEDKLVDNIKDNLFSPISLALVCQKKNIHYTYLGTGCIFKFIEGNKNIDFKEYDIPNFFDSEYSIVKGFTDRLMHQLEDTVLNLRISMPIVDYNHNINFITNIIKHEKIYYNQNSITVLPELLPLVLEMMKKKMLGTINLTNPGTISHNEILELYKKYVNSEFTLENFCIEEQKKILACDKYNNLLDTKRLEDNFKVKNIKDSIEDLLKNY